MKQKIFFSLAMIFSLSLSAANGRFRLAPSWLAPQALQGVTLQQQEDREQFDRALKNQDIDGIAQLCQNVSQGYKNETIDALLKREYYGFMKAPISPTDQARVQSARDFLSRIIRDDRGTEQKKLTFYTTFFMHALPHTSEELYGDGKTQQVLSGLVHHAARYANKPALMCLVNCFGIDVNDSSVCRIPLHDAVVRLSNDNHENKQRQACIKFLLKCGADPQKADCRGTTALECAVTNGSWREAGMLLCSSGVKSASRESLSGLWDVVLKPENLCSSARAANIKPMMRVLLANNIPVRSELLLTTLRSLEVMASTARRYSDVTELAIIKYLHKKITSQDPGFEVTAEHLELIQPCVEKEGQESLYSYINSCLSEKEQQRYWDKDYTDGCLSDGSDVSVFYSGDEDTV